MPVISGNVYSDDKLKKEIGELIDKHKTYFYEVKKVAEPNAAVELTVTLKMLFVEDD